MSSRILGGKWMLVEGCINWRDGASKGLTVASGLERDVERDDG
jgi:hypothetical protein